jgi:hypothetical protein
MFLKISVRAAALLPFVRDPKENNEICILDFVKISGAAAALPNGKYLYIISLKSHHKKHPRIIRLFSIHKM